MSTELLQVENQALRQQLASLQQALEQLRGENSILRQKLDALARRIFGKKSEQLDPAQLQLLMSGLTQQEVASATQPSLLPRSARPAPCPLQQPASAGAGGSGGRARGH